MRGSKKRFGEEKKFVNKGRRAEGKKGCKGNRGNKGK